MQTRKIAFFFYEHITYSTTTTKELIVGYQYFDEDAQEHLQKYGRYTYGRYNRSIIIKQPNIALVDVPFSYGHWTQFDKLCKSIANCIQHSFHPFKPISHFNLNDYPEVLV